MPVELLSLDELVKVAQRAVECRVKRNTRDGKAKIKVRTKRYLYTYKVDPAQVDEVLSKLNCKNVVDIDAKIAETKKRRAEERKKAKEKQAAAAAAPAAQQQQETKPAAETTPAAAQPAQQEQQEKPQQEGSASSSAAQGAANKQESQQ